MCKRRWTWGIMMHCIFISFGHLRNVSTKYYPFQRESKRNNQPKSNEFASKVQVQKGNRPKLSPTYRECEYADASWPLNPQVLNFSRLDPTRSNHSHWCQLTQRMNSFRRRMIEFIYLLILNTAVMWIAVTDYWSPFIISSWWRHISRCGHKSQ